MRKEGRQRQAGTSMDLRPSGELGWPRGQLVLETRMRISLHSVNAEADIRASVETLAAATRLVLPFPYAAMPL